MHDGRFLLIVPLFYMEDGLRQALLRGITCIGRPRT